MPATTSHSRPRSRRGWRSVVRWIALGLLGFVALALLLAALALPACARGKTREFLQNTKDISGDFLDVQTSLFPLRYTVTHLKIRRNDAVLKDPFFYADRLAVHLRWGPLLTGRFVGNVAAEGVKVVIEQPPSGGGLGRLPTMEDIIPVKAVVERVQIKNSEALYAWVREPNRPTLWFHQIEATLENVPSRPGLTERPMVLAARGTVQRSGTMLVQATIEPFATPVEFVVETAIDHFDLAQMNSYVGGLTGVKLTSGSFSTRMKITVEKGHLTGWVDPRLEGTELESVSEGLGSKLKALLGKVTLTLSAPADGTKPSGKIAVADDLTDPKLQLVAVLEKSVENSFLLSMQEALKRVYTKPPSETAAQAKPQPTPLKTQN
jgi:Domain of Unknown Function (DUF748)